MKGLSNFKAKGNLDMLAFKARPFKKNRLIFGEKSKGALVPFGEYWRTGANAATNFSINSDITISGLNLMAGKYRLYSIPNEEKWEIFINSEADTFFAISEPDYSKDVLATKVPSKSDLEAPVEQFTINFSQDSTGYKMNLVWDKTMVSIPLK